MSRSCTRFAASAARCDLVGANCFRFYVADAAIIARITPCPAERVVEKLEGFPRLQLTKDRGIIGGFGAKLGRRRNLALDRLGVVRRNHRTGQRDVCQVFAESIEVGVGRVRVPA